MCGPLAGNEGLFLWTSQNDVLQKGMHSLWIPWEPAADCEGFHWVALYHTALWTNWGQHQSRKCKHVYILPVHIDGGGRGTNPTENVPPLHITVRV